MARANMLRQGQGLHTSCRVTLSKFGAGVGIPFDIRSWGMSVHGSAIFTLIKAGEHLDSMRVQCWGFAAPGTTLSGQLA